MKLHYCFAASFCLLALSGCQSGSLQASAAPAVQSTAAAETPAAHQTDTAVQSEHESASQTSIDLKGLTDLVGKSDSEVTAVLGQGEEMRNDEGMLLSRDYTLPLLEEDASVSLSFNLYQEGDNRMEQAVVNLGQSDLNSYAQTLTQIFGDPTESYETSYFFSSGDKTLVLADPYGDGAYIEISVNE